MHVVSLKNLGQHRYLHLLWNLCSGEVEWWSGKGLGSWLSSAPTCENRSTLYILFEFPVQTKSECFEVMNIYHLRSRTILALTGILCYRKDWDRLQVRYLSLIKTEYCLAEKTSSTFNSCILRTTTNPQRVWVKPWFVSRNTYQEQKVNEGKKIEMLFFNHCGPMLPCFVRWNCPEIKQYTNAKKTIGNLT